MENFNSYYAKLSDVLNDKEASLCLYNKIYSSGMSSTNPAQQLFVKDMDALYVGHIQFIGGQRKDEYRKVINGKILGDFTFINKNIYEKIDRENNINFYNQLCDMLDNKS
jgi:hypothetical protein